MNYFLEPKLFKVFFITLGFLSVSYAEESNENFDGTTQKPIESSTIKPPVIKKISDTIYQVGSVIMNKKERSVEFTATAQTYGDLRVEYIVCQEIGRIHESLFVTKAKGFDMNVALKLLNFKESKHLFRTLDGYGLPSGDFHKESSETKKAAGAQISARWKLNGEVITREINKMLKHYSEKEYIMPDVAWTYGGSEVFRNEFLADYSGDLIAVLTNYQAIINYSGPEASVNGSWLAVDEMLPKPGTQVTIVIKPFKQK